MDVVTKSNVRTPSVMAMGKIASLWSGLWTSRRGRDTSARENRNAIIAVQWFVAIGTSYLVFAAHDWTLTDPLSVVVILICLISAPIVQRVPDEYFERRLIEPGLLVVNSILIVCAIALPPETPWDLLLLFFFCMFIAAMGENLVQIGVACVLLSIVFLMFVSPGAIDASMIKANLFIRVPFMFGISIFYGHLAGEVKRDKRQIEKMAETMKLRRQLVCALAHDIKTPLNVILGHAELLAEESGTQTSPAEKRFSIECIRKNVGGIVKLITELLDVSKLETVRLNTSKDLVHMNSIIEALVFQQSVTTGEKNLKVSFDLDRNLRPVIGDHGQLQRALGNLLSNAIKFTPSGGAIEVSTRMVGRNISIKVSDSGAGIPKEELAGLFTEYKRLKGAANIEGTGLGLFIVKTIVEAHNGTVTVESEEGVGTTFTVLLPSSKAGWGSSEPSTAVHQNDAEASERHNRTRALTEPPGDSLMH